MPDNIPEMRVGEFVIASITRKTISDLPVDYLWIENRLKIKPTPIEWLILTGIPLACCIGLGYFIYLEGLH